MKNFKELLEIRAYSISDIKGKTITDKSTDDEKIAALIYLAVETNEWDKIHLTKVSKNKITLNDTYSTGNINKKTIAELKYYDNITLNDVVKFLKKKGIQKGK